MTPSQKNGGFWFYFLMTIMAGLMTGIFAIVIEFKRDMISKLDRMTTMFMNEKTSIISKIDSLCDKLSEHDKMLMEHKTLLKMPYETRRETMGGKPNGK